MTYKEKLRDPRWQKKRLKILNRDRFTCRLCRDDETTLHVHHKEYINGDPWDVPDELLITLCEHCHEFVESIVKDDNCGEIEYDKRNVYKSDNWNNGNRIMFASVFDSVIMRIYDKDGSYIIGFNIPQHQIKDIVKVFKRAL